MDIVLHSLGMPFNGETVYKQSLGGSETAAYYQARELAKRGHRVSIFTNSQDEGEFDGVRYCWAGNASQEHPLGERFEFYAQNTPHDVLIIQRHPAAFHKRYASKINIWQLHDLALYRSAGMMMHGLYQIDGVTCVSKWHKEQVQKVYGISDDVLAVVPNGIDPDLYAKEGPPFLRRTNVVRPHDEGATHQLDVDPNTFVLLYQSRPERGLEHLVRPGGIMDRLRDTKAHLLIAGYDNTVPQMRAYYDQLKAWASALPNVTHLGAFTKPQLASLQKSCDVLVYPTEFEEVSCITAMEAMAAGLPMLTSAHAALPETCENSGTILIPLKDGKADEDAFVAALSGLVSQDLSAPKQAQLAAGQGKTWEKAVDELEALIANRFSRYCKRAASIVRHGIEHSDINLAEFVLAGHANDDVIAESTKAEIESLYGFRSSDAAYRAHYAFHQAQYYDDFEDRVVGEDVTGSARFRGAFMFMQQEMELRPGQQDIRVLDYGCAHGHYLIPMAKVFRQAEFTGVDVSARAIGAAMKWVQKEGLSNVRLLNGGQDLFAENRAALLRTTLKYDQNAVPVEQPNDDGTVSLAQPQVSEDRKFDVILAGEVLEHVADPIALLEQFRSVLNPGGAIILTTPIGRWEWTGTEAFRTGREHLHHFEREDILEICADNPLRVPEDICFAPAGQDRAGGILGSWIWRVRPEAPFKPVNYTAKLGRIAPRETVSACLIVKDGERTLRKCVESFIDWVDQIVIAVDPTTRDRTKEITQQLCDDYPLKPILIMDGLEALKDGFAAARNVTIEAAVGDWILWLDADEEVQQPWNLWKYLRPSHHDGFGFPQVHYSCNPPQVLTTDYPCRLFRRNKGIQFHGAVHEHPETEPGKAIPTGIIKHDVQFLHAGYVDEETRRKRFQRNLPLLYRDRAENPTRGLNRFLWLRDTAQSLMFEHEQTAGHILEGHKERALEGIKLFEEMIDKDTPRILIDALPYYSHCVVTTGGGFESEVSFAGMTPAAPDLAVKLNFKGQFHSRDCLFRLTRKIQEEATKFYEDRYL